MYNRYRLRRQVATHKWTHEQECQLRHYVLTITKSNYTFWCIRPNLKDGDWDECTMTRIFLTSLTDEQGVYYFVDWINEIHRWGLTSHIESCEKDIKSLLKTQRFRISDIEARKECTCNDSRDDKWKKWTRTLQPKEGCPTNVNMSSSLRPSLGYRAIFR